MQMKVTGPAIELDVWRAIAIKLLDLVGQHLTVQERRAAMSYIELCRRAWPDLERRARTEAPIRG